MAPLGARDADKHKTMRPSDLPPSHADQLARTDPFAALWPAVDAQIGRASTGGNEALYRRLLRMFRTGQRDAMRQFREARAAGDLKSATRVVHSLRTVAASLGMPALARASRALETGYAEGGADDARLERLMAQVEQSLTSVLDGLDTISLD